MKDIRKFAHYTKPWADTIFIPLLKIGLVSSLFEKEFTIWVILLLLYNYLKCIVYGSQFFGKFSMYLACNNTKKYLPLKKSWDDHQLNQQQQ